MAEELARRFDAVPFNRMLGMRLVSVSEERVEVALSPGADLRQEQGVIHGGAITALADTAAVYLTLPDLEEGERMASVELKVNFLQPAWVDGGELRAEAVRVRGGRRLVVCEARVRQGEREVLRGLFTYMRFREGG